MIQWANDIHKLLQNKGFRQTFCSLIINPAE